MPDAAARDEGRRRYSALSPGAFCYSVDLCCGTSLATTRRCFPLRTPIQPFPGVTMRNHVVIEDWEGDGAIRLPDDVLQEMGVDVGDTLYLLEEYVGTTRCLVLSKSPRIPDRVDELVGHWESFGKVSAEINAKDE